MNKNKKKQEKTTFTKKWITIIMIVSLIDLQLTYILAFFNKEIAETLAVAIVTEIIGLFLGYMCKSFFETKEEEKNKLLKELDEKENDG